MTLLPDLFFPEGFEYKDELLSSDQERALVEGVTSCVQPAPQDTWHLFILGIGVIHAGCAKNRDEPLWTRQALSRNAWLLSPAGALLMFWFLWFGVRAHRVDRETERE